MSSSDRKVVVASADMPEEMQQDAIDYAMKALDNSDVYKDMAFHLKREFDKKYNPTWHCIVGKNFGSYVSHETGNGIYFYIGQRAILLFKAG